MITKDQLTKEQQEFFKKNKVSYELLFDAKGEEMSDELIAKMSELDAVIAINTTVCENNPEHHFRTIAGFCPQCDPAKVATALVEHKVGFVYIAGSLKGKLIKVGCTGDTKGRVNDLNTALAKYANYDDWVILYEAKTLKIGKVERTMHTELDHYKTSRQHTKAGKLQNAHDIYQCSYSKARNVITQLQDDVHVAFTQIKEKAQVAESYQFANLRTS